jgi:phosphoglycolate phosphatase-like HAD superfamily hydrolase
MNLSYKAKFEDMEKRGCPVVALCYDFDKTLSPRDMQEYGFIERLGMTPDEFWSLSNNLVENRGMDMIMAYMHTMIFEAKKRNIDITMQDMRDLGKKITLFKGVEDWFDRINDFGVKNGVITEHYIISSGLEEIIGGISIANEFKRIYASSFFYDESGKAIWPRKAVNSTSKTQYLFRINKSTDDVNVYMPDELRRVPFTHFIYIGDSMTDIPCMRLIKSYGGNSVGVFNPEDEDANKLVKRLLLEGRINYYAPTDYTKGSSIEDIIHKIILDIKTRHDLLRITRNQKADTTN